MEGIIFKEEFVKDMIAILLINIATLVFSCVILDT